MTQYLPPNLLALFAPRDPIPYLPPNEKLPFEKKTRGYSGVGCFLGYFEDPKDTPPPVKYETREERNERKKRERTEQAAYKLEQGIALWDPMANTAATSDPYKTMFIARLNYDTTESKLRREFEVYGAIKKIGIVVDKVSGKPRGYAFIEFEHERDMHSAYKHADGKKIDGRRVLVDVERGRTVKGWLPRRLGGGLGGTRRGAPDENVKHSGRDDGREDRERFREEREGGRRGDRDRAEKRRSRSRDRGDRDRDRKRRRSRSPRSERTERTERPERADRTERDRPERPERVEKERDRSERGDRDKDRERRRDERKRESSRIKREPSWEKSQSQDIENEDNDLAEGDYLRINSKIMT